MRVRMCDDILFDLFEELQVCVRACMPPLSSRTGLLCAYVCVCRSTHLCVRLHVHMCVCRPACVCAHLHVCVLARMHFLCGCVCTVVRFSTRAGIFMCVRACMEACVLDTVVIHVSGRNTSSFARYKDVQQKGTGSIKRGLLVTFLCT